MNDSDTNFSKFPIAPEWFLVFFNWAHGFDEYDTQNRGYRACVYLNNKDKNYPLFFYDPIRLNQELADKTEKAYLAEHGMIIVKEVTLEMMITTVKCLLQDGFFKNQATYSFQEIKMLFGLA